MGFFFGAAMREGARREREKMANPAPQRTRCKFRVVSRSLYSEWAGQDRERPRGLGEQDKDKRPKPCTVGGRARSGHSDKLRRSEAIPYVDWA